VLASAPRRQLDSGDVNAIPKVAAALACEQSACSPNVSELPPNELVAADKDTI
jgi:hypothetical protein